MQHCAAYTIFILSEHKDIHSLHMRHMSMKDSCYRHIQLGRHKAMMSVCSIQVITYRVAENGAAIITVLEDPAAVVAVWHAVSITEARIIRLGIFDWSSHDGARDGRSQDCDGSEELHDG